MNVARVTKIVSACLVLAACHDRPATQNDNDVGYVSQSGVGVESKMGKQITRGRWCSPVKTDGQGVMRREQYDFWRNGKFRRSLLVLNANATFTTENIEAGHWAIVDGQLLFMRDGTTLKINTADYTRTNDGVSCVKISADGDAVEGQIPLCPCEG